jgi:hypothetical protein
VCRCMWPAMLTLLMGPAFSCCRPLPVDLPTSRRGMLLLHTVAAQHELLLALSCGGVVRVLSWHHCCCWWWWWWWVLCALLLQIGLQPSLGNSCAHTHHTSLIV